MKETEERTQKAAEASKAYRKRLTTHGKKAVSVYLDVAVKANLDRICKVKDMTMAEAIAWAVEQAFRLDAIERGSEPSRFPGRYQTAIMERLRAARTAACYTAAQMADALGVDARRYEKWETGFEKIPEKYLRMVMGKLNLPLDYFQDDEGRSRGV